MNFANTDVWGFEHALRGMRNPKNSWDRSDSKWVNGNYIIGDNDLALAQKLIKAGSEHRKFLRQIFISVDITAPLYWWKEFDTYKVGTVASSTSTMHKILSNPITIDCFETSGADGGEIRDGIARGCDTVFKDSIIESLERLRIKCCEFMEIAKEEENPKMKRSADAAAKELWKVLIRWLPESWLQTRTVTMNYENIYSMYRQRKLHKLSEWSVDFVDWVCSLPYCNELIRSVLWQI